MKFLTISGKFAPYLTGGAVYCAYDLSKWLVSQGHEVGVLTAAATPEEDSGKIFFEGMHLWRKWMLRPYPIHKKGPKWQKPLWHMLNHFAPSNQRITAKVLDAFKPDCVLLHGLQGVGLNITRELAKRDIPTVYFLHDLGLACIKQTAFVNGKDCEKHCLPCRLSSLAQFNFLKNIPRLTLCSPSKANLDKISRFFPLDSFHTTVALNACHYDLPSKTRQESDKLRILFVGRLHHTKGVHLLMDVCKALAKEHNFLLTIVGGGEEEESLRQKSAGLSWCHIVGQVEQAEVGNYMINSDVLCAPSLWAENSPGVIIQALSLGLPVIGSDRGGIPELIENNHNGLLVPAGESKSWFLALKSVLTSPQLLDRWRVNAFDNAPRFSQNDLGLHIFAIIQKTMRFS